MDKIKDLTKGNIPSVIGKLAAPLIGSSFIQMAYTMTDMIWLGTLGSAPVAAVGAAFFFVWMGNAISYIPKVGAEVGVSQTLGHKDKSKANSYASNSIKLSNCLSVIYSIIILIFAPFLLKIFHLDNGIFNESVNYLRMVIPGIISSFFILTSSAVYYGVGNSKTPFYLISLGLIVNMILDPVLIFGVSFIPGLGSLGAAIATSIAQLFVAFLFARRLFTSRSPLNKIDPFINFDKIILKRIFTLVLPVSLPSALSSCISMTLASFASKFGNI